MAGTKEGARKRAAKMLEADPDVFRKMGALGGKSSRTGGFYGNPELARKAGAKGGRAKGQ